MANNSINSWRDVERIVYDSKIKLVSFDLFNTLLVRPCEASDVIELTAKLCHISPARYKHYREYNGLKYESKFVITSQELENTCNTEYNLEKQILRPRRHTVKLLESAKKMGKKVIITTDIYYSEEKIVELLDYFNINTYDSLYVSSKYHMTKKKGDLFNVIIEDFAKLDILPDEIVHIGDDYLIDYKKAKECGMCAIHIPRPIEVLRKTELGNKLVTKCLGDRISCGHLANILFDDPFIEYEGLINDNFTIKTYIVSSFLSNFIIWLVNDLEYRGIKKLLLTWRDGYHINTLLNLLKNYRSLKFNYSSCQFNRHLRVFKEVAVPEYAIPTARFSNIFDMYSIGAIDKKIDCCKKIADFSKGFHSIQEIHELTDLIDYDKIKYNSSKLDEFTVSNFSTNEIVAIFDSGYHGSIASFIGEYYPQYNVAEYQIIDHEMKNRCISPNCHAFSFIAGFQGMDKYVCTCDARVLEYEDTENKYVYDVPELNPKTILFQTISKEYCDSYFELIGPISQLLDYSEEYNSFILTNEFGISSKCSIDFKHMLEHQLSDNDNELALLSYMHFEGIGVDKDNDKAIKYLEKAVFINSRWTFNYCKLLSKCGTDNSIKGFELCKKNMSNPYYLGLLGTFLINGKGCTKDLDKGLTYLEKSCKHNPYWLMEYVSQLKKGNPLQQKKAFILCDKLKDVGTGYDNSVKLQLIDMYCHEYGVKYDYSKIEKLVNSLDLSSYGSKVYEILADVSVPEIQLLVEDYLKKLSEINSKFVPLLAHRYRERRSDDFNHEEYLELLKRASFDKDCVLEYVAEITNSPHHLPDKPFSDEEIYNLAKKIRQGAQDISADPKLSISLYLMIYTKRTRWTYELIELIMDNKVNEYYSKLKTIVKNLIDLGDPMGMGYMGRMYREGIAVSKNPDLAIKYLLDSCGGGIKWAAHEVFDLLWKQNTLDDDKKMIEVIMPMACSGDGYAAVRMSRAYRYGRGVPYSIIDSMNWIDKAIDIGVPWAKDEKYRLLWGDESKESRNILINLANRNTILDAAWHGRMVLHDMIAGDKSVAISDLKVGLNASINWAADELKIFGKGQEL